MVTNRTARLVFGLNALVVIVGLIVQLFVTSDPNPKAFFQNDVARVLNVFCFFTVISNLLVAFTTGVLASGRAPAATWFRTLRLMGLVGITLTFIVFQAVLRQLQDLTGQAALADFLLHTVSPILCVAAWVWFGPRRQTSPTVVWLTLTYLIVWGGATLIRGHAIGFYPYPFMDPREAGYARVTVNLVIIGVVFIALAWGAHLLDRHLKDRTTSSPLLEV